MVTEQVRGTAGDGGLYTFEVLCDLQLRRAALERVKVAVGMSMKLRMQLHGDWEHTVMCAIARNQPMQA